MRYLYDYKTGEQLRPATYQEYQQSLAASIKDGGAGVILINNQSCYVI